jgi:hypothetical protein
MRTVVLATNPALAVENACSTTACYCFTSKRARERNEGELATRVDRAMGDRDRGSSSSSSSSSSLGSLYGTDQPAVPAGLGGYPVTLAHKPGKGRCLVTTREVRAGSVVLAEEPALTYLEKDAASLTCAGCLRWKRSWDEDGWRFCQGCGRSHWCCEACEVQDRRRIGGHSVARCAAHAAIAETKRGDDSLVAGVLSYAAAALDLRARDPIRYAALDAQCESSTLTEEEHRAVGAATDVLLQRCPTLVGGLQPAALKSLVDRLVRQDKCNSFGYIAPYGTGERRSCAGTKADADGDVDPTDRIVRGSGVFPLLALANHSCMPTVYRERLRLDTDKYGGNSSLRVAFRAMSTLPAGVEIVHCYVPLGWSLADRTLQLNEEYGIDRCDCARCDIERPTQREDQPDVDEMSARAAKRPKTSEQDGIGFNGAADIQKAKVETDMQGEDGEGSGKDEGNFESSGEDEAEFEGNEERSPWYVTSFLMRHICDNCGGTLAPSEFGEGERVDLAQSKTRHTVDGDGSVEGVEKEEQSMLCCTVCDNTRTAQEEQEFFEKMMVLSADDADNDYPEEEDEEGDAAEEEDTEDL